MLLDFGCAYLCYDLVAPPSYPPPPHIPPCCSTAGCPTLPSCHWGSPRPLHLAELVFWALPHQSSLAAAALSCAPADDIGVGQSHSSCDCLRPTWEDEEVARRLLPPKKKMMDTWRKSFWTYSSKRTKSYDCTQNKGLDFQKTTRRAFNQMLFVSKVGSIIKGDDYLVQYFDNYNSGYLSDEASNH